MATTQEAIVELIATGAGGRGDVSTCARAACALCRDPHLAARCRFAAREALGRSPISTLVDAADRNPRVLGVAGALAGAGCTSADASVLVAAAAPGRGYAVVRGALRALRRACRIAARRRRAPGPPGGACFDVTTGEIRTPALPWPPAGAQSTREYAITMWARVEAPPTPGNRAELARLSTKDGLGVVVALENDSFVVEAAHDRDGGRVSQRTATPLSKTAFVYGRWHHVIVEGRGRGRLSLFGRDELRAWLDGVPCPRGRTKLTKRAAGAGRGDAAGRERDSPRGGSRRRRGARAG